MRWITCNRDKTISVGGQIDHKVWRAAVIPGFYATSGLDTHGPYGSAKQARAKCEAFEQFWDEQREGTA